MNTDSKDIYGINEEVVAVFGEARVVRRHGQLFLIGGCMADRTEALDWILTFLPNEAPRLISSWSS